MNTTKLFVGNIARGSDQAHLRARFEEFGSVAECDIISDYGFVTCYVCGRSGHWAKNCPQVPEEEREKQSRRAERNKRGGFGGYDDERMPYPGDPHDFYDDYDPYPPRRRRPPPPPFFDDYDDYYPRRRLPPPLYYDDPYDYDYPLPPPRRRPPPAYYRYDDPYPLPPRRPPPPRDFDEYRYERAPVERAPPERVPQPVAAPTPAVPVYYDFADDKVERPIVQRSAEDIDPLASFPERESRHMHDQFPSNGGDMMHGKQERFPTGEPERYAAAEDGVERFRETDRQLPAAYSAPGPDRSHGEYYRRAPRPY
ncbi:RNA-binding protein lark-like isoform X2 [Watersipora subatra]|uniref:RNA-binding protein lark-like isoform X2 n=1 Tax=Watersipora subatra TaxID=2589382 RepID=UPI00355B7EC5